jgi:hypothetical protein
MINEEIFKNRHQLFKIKHQFYVWFLSPLIITVTDVHIQDTNVVK